MGVAKKIYQSAQVPQADDPTQVMKVSRLLDKGKTQAQIAKALELDRRQAGYYCDAALIVGLVDDQGSLTYLGHKLKSSASKHNRLVFLRALLDYPLACDLYTFLNAANSSHGRRESELERWLDGKAAISGETVVRRLRTLRSWLVYAGLAHWNDRSKCLKARAPAEWRFDADDLALRLDEAAITSGVAVLGRQPLNSSAIAATLVGPPEKLAEALIALGGQVSFANGTISVPADALSVTDFSLFEDPDDEAGARAEIVLSDRLPRGDVYSVGSTGNAAGIAFEAALTAQKLALLQPFATQKVVGQRRNGDQHKVDIVTPTELFSAKWQGRPGSAYLKWDGEIKDLEKIVGEGGYQSAVMVIEAPGIRCDSLDYYRSQDFLDDHQITSDIRVVDFAGFCRLLQSGARAPLRLAA